MMTCYGDCYRIYVCDVYDELGHHKVRLVVHPQAERDGDETAAISMHTTFESVVAAAPETSVVEGYEAGVREDARKRA